MRCSTHKPSYVEIITPFWRFFHLMLAFACFQIPVKTSTTRKMKHLCLKKYDMTFAAVPCNHIPVRAYYTWPCVIKIPFCTHLKKVIDGASIPLNVFAIPTRKKSSSKTCRSLHPFRLLEYFGGAFKHVQNMFADNKETHFLARRE